MTINLSKYGLFKVIAYIQCYLDYSRHLILANKSLSGVISDIKCHFSEPRHHFNIYGINSILPTTLLYFMVTSNS